MYDVVEGAGPDLSIDIRVHDRRIHSLKELMDLPAHLHKPALAEAHVRLVNANRFKQRERDICQVAELDSMGEVSMARATYCS